MRILVLLFLSIILNFPGAFASNKVMGEYCDVILKKTKHPVTQNLVKSYFDLSLAVKGLDNLPRALRPQSFIYILDELNLGDQERLTTSIYGIINGEASGGDPEILSKVQALDDSVKEFKRKHKRGVKLALENHDGKGQTYGDKPYSTHLRKVRSILKRFGYGPRNSLLGLRLGTAAWLHDIIEDTGISIEVLIEAVGEDIASIVMNLTNEPHKEGVSQEERKRITFMRVASRPESRIIKLADRIANVEESLTNKFLGGVSKIEKYNEEWPSFEKHIRKPGEAEEMWTHLERLLTDEAYARWFVLYRITT